MEGGKEHSRNFHITVLGNGEAAHNISISKELGEIGLVSHVKETSMQHTISDVLKQSDIVIYLSENPGLEQALEVNNLALTLGKTICYIRFEKNISIVSLMIPGITPCHLCACFRRLACTENIHERLMNASTVEYIPDHGNLFNSSISKSVCDLIKSYRNRQWRYSNFATAFVILNKTYKVKRSVFMRRDDCPLCSTNQSAQDISANPIDISLPNRLENLINPYFGVIKGIEKLDIISIPKATANQPIISFSELSNYRLYQSGKETLISYGKGWSDKDSLYSAAGEAIERYSSYCWQPNKLIRANRASVQGICPRKLAIYKDYQYQLIPYVRYQDELILTWIKGEAVLSQKQIFLPALAIFSDWEESNKEPRIFEYTTSGLASGISQDMAFNNALLELVERDAFILFWMLRLKGKRLNVMSHPDSRVRDFAKSHEEVGFSFFLIQLPSDSPAKIVAAFLISKSSNKLEPSVTMGLGASSSLAKAADRAVLELGQVFYLLREKLKDAQVRNIVENLMSGSLPITQPIHHGLYYCHEKAKDNIKFFIDCPVDKAPIWDSDEDECKLSSNILTWISSMGGEVFMVDITPISLREINLYTVRALSTCLQPIHFGKNQERLESPRLKRILGELRMSYLTLNRNVHPLS